MTQKNKLIKLLTASLEEAAKLESSHKIRPMDVKISLSGLVMPSDLIQQIINHVEAQKSD